MRLLLPSLVLLAATHSHAEGLGVPMQVDLIELEPRTQRINLLVLLDDDRVNTRPALKALYAKFNNYQDFINSGQAAAAAPNGSTTIRPAVVVMAPRDASAGELQNLDGLKLAASKVGAAIDIRPHTPGLRAKPVPIAPINAKTGT